MTTGELTISPKFEALRRVHLIPSGDVQEETPETINVNVFRNLDSPVSEGGDNFSTGCVSARCRCLTLHLMLANTEKSSSFAWRELS